MLQYFGLVGVVTALLAANPFAPQDKCADGSYCSGASHCCGSAHNPLCCETAQPCCGTDGCCDSDELACTDPLNGCVCCETEFTFCCAPSAALGLPSRCCPRFNVCCDDLSRFGCCSPGVGEALPLPAAFVDARGGVRPRAARSLPIDDKKKKNGALTAYALLFSAWQAGNGFLGLTIDVATGAYTSVPAPGFPTGGETPRLFTWDGDRKLFHCALTNWSNLIPPQQKRPVVLWTVDPRSGATTHTPLKGVFGQSTGFAYVPATKALLLGTADIDANQTRVNTYRFWSVDLATSVATPLATAPFAAGQDNYAGWFHTAALNGTHTVAFRLGNIDPTITSSAFGVTLTQTDSGAQDFQRAVPPGGFGRYQSITPVGLNDFVSLGSSTQGDPTADLDVVRWSVGSAPKTLATLGNAHRTPIFGPIAETLNGTTYAALVVQDSIVSNKLDTWALAVTDINSGASSVFTLSPFTDAQTDSVAGIGLA